MIIIMEAEEGIAMSPKKSVLGDFAEVWLHPELLRKLREVGCYVTSLNGTSFVYEGGDPSAANDIIDAWKQGKFPPLPPGKVHS